MIKIEKLNKYYPVGNAKFHALKDIDLTINDGEFVAVRGKSGSGKTTLLNMLGCLDHFGSGDYFFNDTNVRLLNDGKLAKIRNNDIGFILQDFSLINYKSVLFNVMLPLFFGKTPFSKMKKLALAALDSVGIADQADKIVNQLSGGQRQRVAIARALIIKPGLILADEPTGALDSETSTQIMDLLKSLNSNGITILVVTHDDFVSNYCKRKIFIKDGVIVNNL